MKTKIEVYKPTYMSGQNKFIEYVLEDFDDGFGHTAKIRYARFKDKNGKEQKMVAQVIWN